MRMYCDASYTFPQSRHASFILHMRMYCDLRAKRPNLQFFLFHFAYAYVLRPLLTLGEIAEKALSFCICICIATRLEKVDWNALQSFILHMHMYRDSKKLCKSHICAVFSLCNTSNTYACSMWWRTLCHQFIGANLPAFLCSLQVRIQP